MASITSRNPNTGRSTPSVDNGSRTQTPTQFVRAKQRIHQRLHDTIKPTLLQLLSLIFTLQVFFMSAAWLIITLPIRIAADIYEQWIRAWFPKLPSVRRLLVWLREALLSMLPDPGPDPTGPVGPGATSSGSGSNPLPTLNVNLGAIRAGSSNS